MKHRLIIILAAIMAIVALSSCQKEEKINLNGTKWICETDYSSLTICFQKTTCEMTGIIRDIRGNVTKQETARGIYECDYPDLMVMNSDGSGLVSFKFINRRSFYYYDNSSAVFILTE